MKQIDDPLQLKLAATRRWWRTTRVLCGVALALIIVAALAIVCYQSDSHLVLSPGARILWRSLILVSGIGAVVGTALYALTKHIPDTALAAAVERRYPVLKERLLSTIELTPAMASGPEASGFSRSMTLSLAEETNRATEGMDFKRAVSTRSLRTASITAVVMVLLLMAQRFASPESFDNWLNRMRNPAADIPVWANTRVWVTPQHELLPVGEGDNVSVTTRGVKANSCTLYYRTAGDNSATWRSVVLSTPKPVFDSQSSHSSSTIPSTPGKPVSDALQFTFHMSSLPSSVELYARANDGRSNDKTIVVEPRPTILNVKMILHFPSYIHREPQVIPVSTGNIAAPVGTQVDIIGTANKPLKSAIFSRDSRLIGPWPVSDTSTKGSIDVRRDGTYGFGLLDKHDFANSEPAPRYEIHAIPDTAPTVQVTRPSTDIDLVPDGSIPLVAHATDDYGVVGVKLAYAQQRGDAMARTGAASMKTVSQGSLPLPANGPATQVNVAERWHIGSIQGKPGDVIRYELDATDNDTLNGPHIGRSSSLNIHLVSLPEMQRKLKENLDEEARAVEQLRKSQLEAQKELQHARSKMDMTALAKAQESQRAVADEAKAITQRVADVSAQLENNNLATKSELERRSAAEQTLQAIGQQKAPDAADAVQHAQTTKTSQATKAQSLAHAEKQQSEIRRDIEKAQDLLARTPAPEQLAAEAHRLATEQQRLADTARSLSEGIKEQKQQTGSNKLSPELKIGVETEQQQQQQANDDTHRLEKQLNAAATEAQERGQQKQSDALHAAAKALQQANVAAQQAQAEQNLAAVHPEKAAPQQDRAAAGLEKAAQQAQRAAAQDPNAANTAEQLEKAAAELRELAKQQRDVAQKSDQHPDAQQSRELNNQQKNIQNQAAQQEHNLNGSQNAQQNLQKAQQNMSQASKQLAQNQAQQAHAPAQQAAQNLDKAAEQAENAAQQIRQDQAAAELADRVERLAQIQSALKTQTERLQNTRQQRRLTPNEKGELGQVAARQQNVEEEARTLAERFPSPSFQSALQNAANQAHPATKNLNPDPQTGQPDTGQQTQAAQAKAAQTLTAVAQALKQQAQASKDQQAQNQDQQQQQQSAQQAQEAAALGELLLAQGLQQQVRQNTSELDRDRRNQPLSPAQQEEARQLSRDQQETQKITNRAAETLNQVPGVPESLKSATEHMERSQTNLNQQQTGQPTLGHQDSALQNLAQAQQKVQQAMQQQQQQQQAQQQAKQGAPQPNKQPGQQPNHNPFTRLEGPGGDGKRSSPLQTDGKFGALSQREQRTMREGQQERVPAEFQDLVNRYYKSLAEKKR